MRNLSLEQLKTYEEVWNTQETPALALVCTARTLSEPRVRSQWSLNSLPRARASKPFQVRQDRADARIAGTNSSSNRAEEAGGRQKQ